MLSDFTLKAMQIATDRQTGTITKTQLMLVSLETFSLAALQCLRLIAQLTWLIVGGWIKIRVK